MDFHRHQQGMTLLELFFAMSISSILLSIGFSGAQQLFNQNRLQADRHLLTSLLKFARSTAINSNTYTVVCTLYDNRCKGVSSPIIVFNDTNNNGRFDNNEAILTKAATSADTKVEWNNGSRIRFNTKGYASGFFGSLKYCTTKSEKTRGFQLKVSRTGRLRHEKTTKHCLAMLREH